jgi:hypothetical protein
MAATELEITSNDLVALIGPDGNLTDVVYEIVEENETYTRLKHSETGFGLKVHNNRVVKDALKEKPIKIDAFDAEGDKNNLETSETIGYEVKEVNEPGGNEMTDANETATETAETSEAAEPKAKAKKTKKKAKAKKELEPFDINEFVAENGGEHWVKGKKEKIKFDHDGYEVLTHAVMNEAKKVYHVFNTYASNGVVSLGRGGKGVTVYPLKGKTVNYTVSKNAKKVESRGEKKQRKGTKTPDEVRKTWEKNGYQKQ